MKRVDTPTYVDRKGGLHKTPESAAKTDAYEIFSRYTGDEDDAELITHRLAEKWDAIRHDLVGLYNEYVESGGAK